MKTVKLYIEPTVVIVSMRVDESVEAYFDPHASNRGLVNNAGEHSRHKIASPYNIIGDEIGLGYTLELRPSPEFNYEAGKDKLTKLPIFSDYEPEISFTTPGDNEIHDEPGNGYNVGSTGWKGRLMRLSICVDMESRLTIGCAGALLTYIARRKAVEYLPSDTCAAEYFRVSKIEMFSLKGVMYVSSY